jgi:hypothetical protein
LLLAAAAANAARVDMSDPRRALGREDDVRIDAELAQDTVSPNSTISVTYQVENLSRNWIAIADKVVDVTFDADERALNMAIGAEVPNGKLMPHMVMIAPGEKKTLSAGGSVHGVQAVSGPFAVVPREVQIRVNVLRDLTAFREAIAKQSESPYSTVAVTSEMFDKWLDANDSIFLNALPVRWSPAGHRAIASAAEPAPAQSGGGTW